VSAFAQPDREPNPPELVLRELGVRCGVEARGNLAILIPVRGERALEDATIREAALAALRRCGFTHAAIEVSDERELASALEAPRA
jgi:hypothetical protein